MALTRISNFHLGTALALYRELDGARAVYEHRNDIGDVLPDCSPRLVNALKDWDGALRRACDEATFMQEHGITPLPLCSDGYPQRLKECDDAPVVLYYKGSADINARRVVSIVGTRHCTAYGQDLIHRFMTDLREYCPEVLIVSGLAYGVDICAHRNALSCGYDTVGVLAHGLDMIYPSAHRRTAEDMFSRGGLLTEFMSCTNADKVNFVRRNRIVAGMADAVVLVESAAKGGGLITTSIASGYSHDVFAFPGPVGAPYSEGCNRLIRDNGAVLLTGAGDFVKAMGWDSDTTLTKAKAGGIERQLFPELEPDEQLIADLLRKTNNLQINIITVRTGLPINRVTALLFQMEMKGVVRPLAGGTYHLLVI